MSDTYSAARGFSSKDMAAAADQCNKITKANGRLDSAEMADAFIAASRPKRSPTHHLFEWDQARGHAIYLVDRAKAILASVMVVLHEVPQMPPARAFPVRIVDGKRGPTQLREILQSPTHAGSMLEDAKRDILRFKHKYAVLRELVAVFAAMDVVLAGPTKRVKKAG